MPAWYRAPGAGFAPCEGGSDIGSLAGFGFSVDGVASAEPFLVIVNFSGVVGKPNGVRTGPASSGLRRQANFPLVCYLLVVQGTQFDQRKKSG
jgi:hypothetical protein